MLIPQILVIVSSLRKEVHDLWAFCLHATLLRQDFTHCGKFPTAASRRSLGSCLSPSVVDHPLGPATDHHLGKPLPHQLTNHMRAPPWADSSFFSSAYGVLAVVSSCCSPPKGRFLCITHPSATGNTTSCPTFMC
jgi:hypothetical protein